MPALVGSDLRADRGLGSRTSPTGSPSEPPSHEGNRHKRRKDAFNCSVPTVFHGKRQTANGEPGKEGSLMRKPVRGTPRACQRTGHQINARNIRSNAFDVMVVATPIVENAINASPFLVQHAH